MLWPEAITLIESHGNSLNRDKLWKCYEELLTTASENCMSEFDVILICFIKCLKFHCLLFSSGSSNFDYGMFEQIFLPWTYTPTKVFKNSAQDCLKVQKCLNALMSSFWFYHSLSVLDSIKKYLIMVSITYRCYYRSRDTCYYIWGRFRIAPCRQDVFGRTSKWTSNKHKDWSLQSPSAHVEGYTGIRS